jgi:hypothetical protein
MVFSIKDENKIMERVVNWMYDTDEIEQITNPHLLYLAYPEEVAKDLRLIALEAAKRLEIIGQEYQLLTAKRRALYNSPPVSRNLRRSMSIMNTRSSPGFGQYMKCGE